MILTVSWFLIFLNTTMNVYQIVCFCFFLDQIFGSFLNRQPRTYLIFKHDYIAEDWCPLGTSGCTKGLFLLTPHVVLCYDFWFYWMLLSLIKEINSLISKEMSNIYYWEKLTFSKPLFWFFSESTFEEKRYFWRAKRCKVS